MSPEEWAKKISDLVFEMEEDLYTSNDDCWILGFEDDFQLHHYVDGRKVGYVNIF